VNNRQNMSQSGYQEAGERDIEREREKGRKKERKASYFELCEVVLGRVVVGIAGHEEFALAVVVTIVSRDDADGGGQGKEGNQAEGDAGHDWVVVW